MELLDRVMRAAGRKDSNAPDVKPGRNDACWCGSGRKYKKCHLPDDDEKARAKACALNCGTA